ncbi:MAG: 3-hydroxyacyl-CoA dehydrogenase family protein [Dehalococcoidia bacterium]|jgi:3-hydroxyacyl-CoA dehydrogenase|nr:3-hydroxyacyl-CoA dehydrogenase family protein [Dehalococcoidia bacterium]
MKSPADIKKIAVIGAGLMGHGIALEFAAYGRSVSLHDVSEELLGAAMERARAGLAVLARAGRITDDEVATALARITASGELGEAVANADLVIEAVTERLELKKAIFEQIDTHAPAHAILVSNTSTFLPGALASATKRPRQVAVVHYYNPPHLLPGVEVVKGRETAESTINLLMALYQSIGKKPALVRKEIQGFIGNRLQVALLREAMSLVENGYATPEQIDEIVRTSFGRRLSVAGPFELRELVGLDLGLAVSEQIVPTLANDRVLPPVLLDKIESGDLGVKTGKGFYDWTPESIEKWRANMADALLDMASRDR